MTIQSDRWIREQAQKGMIEPFSDGLVREGVISYGISSFGYDLRAAPDWRIFVNAFNTVVDPKNFNTDSLVEAHGETCIIPPNSFVLTRSIEYLRIPEDVMVVALGKSSYARCFRGDTRVALVDGTSPTLEEMAERHAEGEQFFGYSIGQHGELMVTLLDAPRFVGRDSLVEVELDNGERITCTPDHKFLTRDGQLQEAESLRPGSSLMPLYRDVFRGYEMVYLPLMGYHYPTHRLADDWNLRNGIYEDEPGTHRHHIDHDRRNNSPWNLMRIDAGEHSRYHDNENDGAEFDPEGELSARAWQRDTGARRSGQREIARSIRLRPGIGAAGVRAALDATGSIRGAAGVSGCHRSLSRRSPDISQRFEGTAAGERRNHKVAAVRRLRGEEDVYCLTVPEAGNFALEAGVFVQNCGIVANVTPLEPGWEGHVTLELSNTTPLPAKVYANEGIVQLLFFKGERPETTYADRKGKYQGQRGVTLPRL